MSDATPHVMPWDHDEDELVAATRIFDLRRCRGRSPSRRDHSGEFVYLDSADWVNVIAVTPADEVVLIEQFRHGTREVTLEIPGGIVDGGETPLAAGLRELREETGYAGENGSLIGVVTPNPAIMNNRCHTVLVRGVHRAGEQALESNEEISVRLEPLSRVAGLMRSGRIQHALVVAAFHHLLLQESA
jgi:8-oxo-dGTP pyrophosphatase MutT (NUDIX family)